MRRFGPIPPLLVAALAGATGARAQATGAFVATLDGPPPALGLDAPLRVRLSTATGGAPVSDARLRDVRLLSPVGAPSPVRGPQGEPTGPGVYLFRGDLPLAGAWTLSFTAARPGAAPVAVTLGFVAGALPAAAPFSAEPQAPALAAGDPTLAPAPPAIVAPGPAAPSIPRGPS